MARIKKILHSAISVKNIHKSITFYRDVLGLEIVFGPTEEARGKELSVSLQVKNTVLRQAVLKIPDTEMMIELLEYGDTNRSTESQPPQNAIGHAHIAFEVDNMQEIIRQLRSNDVEFYPGPSDINDGPLAGWTWVYFKDPDGTVLELVEIKSAQPISYNGSV